MNLDIWLRFHNLVIQKSSWSFIQHHVEHLDWRHVLIVCDFDDVECLRGFFKHHHFDLVQQHRFIRKCVTSHSFHCLSFLLSQNVPLERDIFRRYNFRPGQMNNIFFLLLDHGARLKHIKVSQRNQITTEMLDCQYALQRCIAMMTTWIGIKRYRSVLQHVDRFLILIIVKEIWKTRREPGWIPTKRVMRQRK